MLLGCLPKVIPVTVPNVDILPSIVQTVCYLSLQLYLSMLFSSARSF